METKNVCPYCGGTNFRSKRREMLTAYATSRKSIGGDRAICRGCGVEGPFVEDDYHNDGEHTYQGVFEAAIRAFCHPAHLMASIHAYDPQTEVKVSRNAAEHVASLVAYYRTTSPDGLPECVHCTAALAEFRAALEGK